MQAAEQVATPHDLEVVDQSGVTILVGVALVLPSAERMGARGYQAEVVAAGDVRHLVTQQAQRLASLRGVVQDRRGGLDLRLQQFLADTLTQRKAARAQEARGHVRGEVARGAINEEEFLLDAIGQIESVRSGCDLHDARFPDLLSSEPLMQAFLEAVDAAAVAANASRAS